MSRRTVFVCDACKNDIDISSGHFVDMYSYGVHTHVACFALLSAQGLVELLKLDSITFGPHKTVLAHEPAKFRSLLLDGALFKSPLSNRGTGA